jgi:hypothetical protein
MVIGSPGLHLEALVEVMRRAMARKGDVQRGHGSFGEFL